MCYIFIQPKEKEQARSGKTMDCWFEKGSKAQEKYDMESLGIRFEPIVFYPNRNEYELCIELSGCPEELVKATYEMGKLKVEGQKYNTKFVQEFSVPADCLPVGIYGQYQGEVLRIIMPRLLSEWPRSEDASSKQEEDDRKATTEVGEDHDKVKNLAGGIKRRNSSSWQKDDVNAFDREELTGRLPTLLSSDQKSIEEVKERGGKERDKLPSRVSAPTSSDQKEREGKDRDKLLTRVPTLPSSEQKKRKGKDHDKLPTKIPAPLSSDQKEMKEREGKDRDKLLTRVSTLPSSEQKKRKGKDHDKLPTKILAPLSSDQKEMKEREGKDRDKLLIRIPTTRVPAPLSSFQKEMKEKETKDRDKLPARVPEKFAALPPAPERSSSIKKLGENYQRNLSKTVAPPPPPPPSPPHAVGMTPWNQKATKIRQEDENANNAKIVTESNDKEQGKVKKPSGDGGNKMLGLVAKVKETGKAAVSAAMKEENRLVVMIGVVLTIVVLGASWRRKKKQKLISM